MQIPLQVTFRNLQHSPALESEVRAHADRLDKFHDRIMSRRIVIEERHKHHRQGNHFHVTVDVAVPGAELVASREPDAHHRYADVHVAIRDAFDSMRRQLEDYARRRDGRVKAHGPPRSRIETPEGG